MVIDHVVQAAGVFKGDGFIGVDIPHLCVLDIDVGVGKNVVERTQHAVELVGRGSLVVFLRDGVAGVAESIDGVFAGIGV